MAEQVQVAKSQLAHLAHHDVLTDLPNRILLQDRFSLAIELTNQKGWKLALMFMDLDRFKHINDTLGHSVDDQLLQSVAKRLVSCARQSDTISRIGGDEFVLLLPFIERIEDATLCARKIIAAFELPHRIDHHDLHTSISIGINQMINNPGDANIVIAVIGLGKSLKKRVIAEGVETPEQLAFLRDQHCYEIQGNYFGCPMTADALTAILHNGISSTLFQY